MTIQDQRQKLQKERWGHGKVWVYVSSIYLQRPGTERFGS